MIRPGLERITRLLRDVPFTWKAVHVAGTNGKGSTSTFLSGMLYRSGIRTGRFNSPHLIDVWDSISVNESPISERVFRDMERRVMLRNDTESIGASEFEVLTATAFMIFEEEKIDVAVVECGLGGRLDATNVLQSPILTIITRIGLDHQSFLGNTVSKIATEKAGILKPGADCLVDMSSGEEALDAIRRVAEEKAIKCYFIPDAGPETTWTPQQIDFYNQSEAGLNRVVQRAGQRIMPWTQQRNLAMALRAYNLMLPLLPKLQIPPKPEDFVRLVAENNTPPARFQYVDISTLHPGNFECVLDGAHNAQAWEELIKQTHTMRTEEKPDITWILACTQGKDVKAMFGAIPSNDTIILTEFGPVAGMPWVKAMPAAQIMPERYEANRTKTQIEPSVAKALCLIDGANLVVIAGSLYLASDVLRLIRDSTLCIASGKPCSGNTSTEDEAAS